MEILDCEHDRPASAASECESAERLEREPTPGFGGYPPDCRIFCLDTEKAQKEGSPPRLGAQGVEASGHFVADELLPVAFHDAEAPLEQLDHGEQRNGLAVGDAAAFEVDNILAEVPAELVQDPRLPDTSLGDDSDHFAAALPGSIERLPKLIELSLTAHQGCELGPDVHARASLAKTRDLVGHDGHLLSLERQGRERLESERSGGHSPR